MEARRTAGRRGRRDRLRRRAGGRGDRAPVRRLPLLRQARAAGRGRAGAGGGGLDDDGAARLGHRRLADAPARGPDRGGGRRAHRLGRAARSADGARGLLDLGPAGALRGHPGVELRRLVRHWPGGLRGVRAPRPLLAGARRRRRARPVRVDLGWRVVRERGIVGPAGHRRRRRHRDGRVRPARPAPAAGPVRVLVAGAGVGGLSAAIHLAHAGHRVTVLEQEDAPGGKAARITRGGFTWDAGPSLLTLPAVFEDLFASTGAPLSEELELLRVEPVTRYRFADGSAVELSADLERSCAALDAWAPGAGEDWRRFMGIAARMWDASQAFLNGPPPWPPRRPRPGDPALDPRDALRVQPWRTLSGLARATVRDRRLQTVVERFATYAGGDPPRTPAAFAVAGSVEHAFRAWHPHGGIHELVLAMARRLEALGGELRTGVRVEGLELRGGRARGLRTSAGTLPADAVVAAVDEAVVRRWAGRPARRRERSVSGLALLIGLDALPDGMTHHEIRFPRDPHEEFDDLFVHRRPVRDPTVYLATPAVTDP